MIEHIVLIKFKSGIPSEHLDLLMRQARTQLLRVPEVLTVRAGKRIWPEAEWPFYISIEVENMDRLAMALDDPNFIKFREEVIKPVAAAQLVLDYELEPGKNIKYS